MYDDPSRFGQSSASTTFVGARNPDVEVNVPEVEVAVADVTVTVAVAVDTTVDVVGVVELVQLIPHFNFMASNKPV